MMTLDIIPINFERFKRVPEVETRDFRPGTARQPASRARRTDRRPCRTRTDAGACAAGGRATDREGRALRPYSATVAIVPSG